MMNDHFLDSGSTAEMTDIVTPHSMRGLHSFKRWIPASAGMTHNPIFLNRSMTQ